MQRIKRFYEGALSSDSHLKAGCKQADLASMDAVFPMFVMAIGFWGVIRFARRPLTRRELDVAERPKVQTAAVALLLRGIERVFGPAGVRVALVLIFVAIFAVGTRSLVAVVLG